MLQLRESLIRAVPSNTPPPRREADLLLGRPIEHVLGQYQLVYAQLPYRTLILQIANLAVNARAVSVVLTLLVRVKRCAFGVGNTDRW